ncbi:MAG TPA: right-handed parallel beta-helix repeat-containing protein, partial [Bryobacteraceae bacterium]|nr:right-handed parallel beta-helix repeat-containing protein [Bryobacteraceae bacterium]
GMNPAVHNVTAKHRKFAFEVSGKSYITINGVNIFAATIDSDSSSSHLVINHVNASYLTHSMVQWTGHAALSSTGIALNGTSDLIENSRINFSAGDGVYLGGSGSRVTNCIISNTDYGGTDAAPIRVYASGCTIDHNTIACAGQNGIVLRASATQILNNIIHDCGLQTTDCAGIYAIRQDGAGGAIAFNLIYNVVTGGFGGSGIQLDDYSSDYLIYRNVTWNVNDGMKITYVSKNDRIYNNTLGAIKFSIQTNNKWDWSGTQVCNNIFTHTAQFGLNATCENNLAPGTNAMFVNPSANQYQLQSVSPAIDKGMQIGSYTTGYSGAAPDQGAYERGLPLFLSGASLT